MDIAAFADDNFDEKEWINKLFRSPEAQENKDAFTMSLVKKLQVYIQQVGVALEDGSQKVLQSLPRVVRDTEILHQEALLLRDKMHAVKAEIAKAEQDTGQSMAALERVDCVKAELQAARQALREADNWTILATDIEEKFEQGDLDGAATTLESMQQSLRILVHAPDVEDKRLQLEGLKNRLEATASPLLVQAFTSASVDQSRRFVRMFGGIERLPQLLQYHHKCQEKALLQQLRDLAELEADDNATDCLQTVYHTLHKNWDEQARWCSQVFSPTPTLSVLLPLFADLLIGLEPNLSACVGSCLVLSDPLAALSDLRQVTRHAAATLQNAVETLASASPGDPDVVLALAQAVNAPWVVAVQRYGELERPGLQSLLGDVLEGEEVSDRVQSLTQASTRVAELTTEALERCAKLTEMCGAAGLVEALQEYVKSLVGKHREVLQELSAQKGEKEDWTLFQLCLTMLQASGELLTQVEQAEGQVARSLRDLSSHLLRAGTSPFQQHDQLLLTPEGRAALQDLMAAASDIGSEPGKVLTKSVEECRALCSEAQRTAVEVIFAPISAQLRVLCSAEIWTSSALSADLPDFSFSPQEYITQVGQYLMTLPQHLEPFLLRDNPGVGVALRAAGATEGAAGEEEGGPEAAALLLGAVASSTSQAFCDQALAIEHISPGGAKQLATDISYLGNVLEDLGLNLSEPLRQACQLLRASPETYREASSGFAPRLVTAVRQMRSLPSS